MAISFDKALGIHEQALAVRTTRARLIATNLANSDTPNFKARDIDFRSILNSANDNSFRQLQMRSTNAHHRLSNNPSGQVSEKDQDFPLLYRTPSQPSIDGNTVDEHAEHGQFMENALAFQASFTLLNKKFSGLKSAIRGE